MRPFASKEDFARLGDEIYDRKVLPHLTQQDAGKYVVIAVVSGDFELDCDEIVAGDRLRTRRPDAQVWLTRAGSRYARRWPRRYLLSTKPFA